VNSTRLVRMGARTYSRGKPNEGHTRYKLPCAKADRWVVVHSKRWVSTTGRPGTALIRKEHNGALEKEPQGKAWGKGLGSFDKEKREGKLGSGQGACDEKKDKQVRGGDLPKLEVRKKGKGTSSTKIHKIETNTLDKWVSDSG